MKPKLCLLIALQIALLASATQASTVYRWVDQEGKVHFSADKPKSLSFDKLKVKNKPSSDAKQARNKLDSTRKARIEKEAKDNASANQEDKAESAALAESLKSECDKMKRNLEILKSGVQVRQKTSDGGFGDYYDDAQRTNAIKENASYIKVFCNQKK